MPRNSSCSKAPAGPRGDPHVDTDYLHLKGVRDLDRRGLALLRELYVWREATSAGLDRASFRVLGNEVLLALAQHPVRTTLELAKVKGIGRENAERRADEILSAIDRGLAVPEAELPRIKRSAWTMGCPIWPMKLSGLKR